MNTLSQKNPFPTDHLTEILHENLSISAFWREDESNQQLLRLYKIWKNPDFWSDSIETIY